MSEQLTEKQLLVAAKRQGYEITSDQLKRWRQTGLIPRPVQEHVAGRRGSRSTYPPGTLRQLLDVCQLHAQFRQLERVRFELWWAGQYHGELAPVREYMAQRLERLLSKIREVRDQYDDPLEAAEAAVDEIDFRDSTIRAMKRMAKSDGNFRSGIVAVLTDLFGGDVPWDLEDPTPENSDPPLRQLVERITGTERARSDIIEAGIPLLDQSADILDAIQLIHRTGAIDVDHPSAAIQRATDEELTEAATTARVLFEGLGTFARMATLRHGRDHAGLSILSATPTSDPTFIAFALQFTLHLPSLLRTSEERKNAAENIDALRLNQVSARCIERFCKEHPGYAFIFKPKEQKRIENLPDEEREIFRQTVDVFLTKYPECAALMTADE